MSIDISYDTIRKLEHTIPEIRTRAINNVQSKFQSCRTDLQDLVVDVNDLIKHLMKWFELKPVTHAKQIFEILLLLLQSKYQAEAVRILNRYSKRGDLRKIQIFAEDPSSKGYYDEIIHILNSHKVEFLNAPKHETAADKNGRFESHTRDKTPETCESWKFKDINANSCSADGFQLEPAWEVAEQKETNAMSSLKSSISTKHSKSELNHALQYFQQYIFDFPGEFFLQPPFIFTNLLQLIECEVNNFDHMAALECCLKLTQNLSRRVIVRRVSCMHVFSRETHHTKQQVTIASYCYKTFNSVLNLLRNIYAEPNLANVNECFLILIEVVELIFKSAGEYSAVVEVEYHLDEIIKKLTDLLRFIREMTSNYRQNGHRTHRNNSLSIVYLLCKLVLFKEKRNVNSDDNARELSSIVQHESTNQTDLSICQKFQSLNFKDAAFLDGFESSASTIVDNRTVSESTLGDFVTATENGDQVNSELEIALLDFPLKHFYPEINSLIAMTLKIDSLPSQHLSRVLMKLTESLEPIVMLLQNPKMFTNEQILSHSLKSLDVLTLINSDQLTQLIFRAIANLTSKFNSDEMLRENSELLFLHLFTFGSVEMKRLVYKLTSEKMSNFYESVLDGKKIIPKTYVSSVPDSCLFGLPLSAEILSEIVCNGLSNPDVKTATFAENIIILILRVKTLAPSRWSNVCKFLTPVLPLLLCHAKTSTAFGQQILRLVEPAPENDLPTVILIKSSVALLFSRDAQTRSEALFRLLYLIQNVPNAELYMPNMNCIADTILSDLFLIEPTPYTSNKEFCDLYEVNLVENLLEVLKNPNNEPSIRHSTLTQLNIVVEDPVALNHFYEMDGHSIILKALDLALREKPVDNYPYSAIQIVGILTKMCLRIPTFRRQVEDDIQTYVLIVRSLLLFNSDDKFRRECVILLFALSFSGYIVGGSKQLIIAPVCRKLALPFECEFSWKSMLKYQNLLEIISNYEKRNDQFDDLNSNYSARSSQSSVGHPNVKGSDIWRYIRLAFNALWFDSLDQLIGSLNYVHGSKTTEINYKNNPDSLSFNHALRITLEDLEIVKGTSQKYGLQFWVKHLKNATSSAQVALSCAAIENFSNIGSDDHRNQWDTKMFLQSITRFCTIMPNTQQDEIVFNTMCHLLTNLVERNFIDVHVWILDKFWQKNCIFIDLIDCAKVSTTMFLNNVRFIEAVMIKAIRIESKKVQQVVHSGVQHNQNPSSTKCNKSKTKPSTNLYEHIFEIARTRLDLLLKEKKLDEMRVLISLIRALSSSGQVLKDDYIASFISNRLLKMMLIISSFSYVGSNLNKNCLLTISHVMISVEELRIEKKYIAFLTNLCGHVDFEVRTYSWSILLKVASTLTGARDLVQEMNSLPGGLYACCLNTVLDDTESALVRENAAFVFSTLISYRNASNEPDESLYPKSAEGFGCEWIGQLIYHYDLIQKIIESIKYLHVEEMIDADLNENDVKIVPCNLMRSYCTILTHLLPLKGAGDVNDIFIAMLEISKVVPKICQSVNKSSVLLLTEISRLISDCIAYKKSLSDVIVRDYPIVHSLISMLSVDLFNYESIPNAIKHACWPRVLKVLRRLAVSTVGFQTICEALHSNQECFDGVVTLFIYGLSDKEFNVSVMRFLTDMLILSQMAEYSFVTFADLLNEVPLSSHVKESTRSFIFNGSNISQRLVNWVDGSESPENQMCTAEIVYGQLVNLFERFEDSSSNKKTETDKNEICWEYCNKAIEALLKCSQRARTLATNDQFLLTVVEQMEKVSLSIGGSFTDFVRRNGNVKVEKYVKRLKLLLNIILTWYSVDCLQDTACIQPLVSICQKFWPSIGVDAELQRTFMKMLLFLSRNSLPVCKALCTAPQFSGSTSAFLNSIVEFCIAETGKPKTTQANMEILELALKIVANCCDCVEGRVLIIKARMLHTLTRLHPQVTRNQKPWPKITGFWLSLYEVLTRHNDANKEAHINLLTNIIEAPSRKNRQLALEILRNMSFNSENRTALLSSTDFMRVVYAVLDKTEIGEEQLLITVAIWKLVANNAKGKNIVKNSPISTKLRALREAIGRRMADCRLRLHSDSNDENALSSGDETIEDLSVALKTVMQILNI